MSKNIPFKNDINKLLDIYETPFYVYDENNIKNTMNNLINIFNKKFNFQHFFAVKALPNPNILKIIIEQGSGLDCSSLTELKIAESFKLNPNKIIFTSNYTSTEDLKYAYDMGVIINLDDYSLINKLYNIYNKFPDKIFFRLNPGIGNTDSVVKSNILGGPGAKFGISPENIIKCYKLSKKLGCKEYGIHMMTGSCVLDNGYWSKSIQILIDNIIKIENEVDIKIKYVNIGGGIGIPYKLDEKSVDINELVNNIYNIFIKNNRELPILYMENGRYITGPHGWLISKCNCVKKSFNSVYYGLDACMSNLMRPGMYNSYHHISVLNKNNNDLMPANVVGTLCENNDWFAKERLLPLCNENDIFIIHDVGAHSHSMGFQYNGKLRSSEILYTKKNEFKIIRKKETFNDYLINII